jgi:hypothetical protein
MNDLGGAALTPHSAERLSLSGGIIKSPFLRLSLRKDDGVMVGKP